MRPSCPLPSTLSGVTSAGPCIIKSEQGECSFELKNGCISKYPFVEIFNISLKIQYLLPKKVNYKWNTFVKNRINNKDKTMIVKQNVMEKIIKLVLFEANHELTELE